MDIELLRVVLGWSVVLNYAVLSFWVVLLLFAKDWIYSVHSSWFGMSREHYDIANYILIGGYKLLIFIFLLMPYLSLRFFI